jgi:hypothetical protein
MELLLNLVWLLLAVPAYWLWRRSGNARAGQGFGAVQILLALACVLVLLFPVISATDDLHAMRAEIEESPVSKRSIRQASTDRASAWNIRLLTPAVVEDFRGFAPGVERADLPLNPVFFLPKASVLLRAGRAPPAGRLA